MLLFFSIGAVSVGREKNGFVTLCGKNAESVMSSESRAYLDDKQSSVQRPRPLRLQGCLAPGGGGDGAGVVGLVRVLGLFGVLGGNPPTHGQAARRQATQGRAARQ